MIHYCPGVGIDASKKQKSRILSNSKGQGTVEYILMLVVTVALVFGLAGQFFTPFKNWAANYFGEYLQCLLETGELPTLGGTATRFGICNTSFKAFSMAEGRPPGAPVKSTNEGSEKTDGEKNDPNKTASNSSEGTRGVGESGYRGRRMSSLPSSDQGGDTAGSGKKRTEEAYTGSAGLFTPGTTVIDRLPANKKSKYVGITGLTDAEKDKIEKTKNKVRKMASEGNSLQAKKKMRIQRQLEKKANVAPEAPMGIGDWFRILLIVLIIIAILFFFLSQATQIAKSWEK